MMIIMMLCLSYVIHCNFNVNEKFIIIGPDLSRWLTSIDEMGVNDDRVAVQRLVGCSFSSLLGLFALKPGLIRYTSVRIKSQRGYYHYLVYLLVLWRC